MNPIPLNPRVRLNKLVAMLVVLMTLVVSSANAQQATPEYASRFYPHWENGLYGYWQETSPGYEADEGYWDYDTGAGHYEYYCPPIYDDLGNFIGEGPAEVSWVKEGVWVPVLVQHDATYEWVEMEPPHPEDDDDCVDTHSISLDISICEPDNFAGRKAWALLKWEIDKKGNVSELVRETGIESTVLFWGAISVPGGGNSYITGNPGSESAQIMLNGFAYSKVNVPGMLANPSDFSIDWLLNISMNYGKCSDNSTGYVIGTHDRYPTLTLDVDNRTVYKHDQESMGVFFGTGARRIDTETFGSVHVNEPF